VTFVDERPDVSVAALQALNDDAIRISFWALHQDSDIDRLAACLAKQLAVPV